MIDSVINKFFKNTVYIRFSAHKICVKHVETGHVVEDTPLLALKPDPKGNSVIVAVGEQARAAAAEDSTVGVYNGFSHPRVCISDIEIAQAVLRYFIREVVGKRLMIRPIIIMHPTDELEGGLSEIERHAIRELAVAAGARKVFVWVGQTLKDVELISLNIPEP